MNLLKKLQNKQQLHLTNLINTFKVAVSEDSHLVKWSSGVESSTNFGDELNPWLYNKITGIEPINSNKIYNYTNKTTYSCIGSILDNSKTKNMIVWGSGFMKADSKFIHPPREITAVRGPLTREKVLDLGIDCPEVYGDPALLLPKFYNPKIEKKYKLGIIAHYIDKNHENYKKLISSIPDDILIIDIEGDIEEVIDNILSCEKVASSSLHGVIVSDAYSIPSVQLKFSDDVVGGSFKFKDYMASVNRQYKKPLVIENNTSINDIFASFYNYDFDIDLNKLLKACPFLVSA